MIFLEFMFVLSIHYILFLVFLLVISLNIYLSYIPVVSLSFEPHSEFLSLGIHVCRVIKDTWIHEWTHREELLNFEY